MRRMESSRFWPDIDANLAYTVDRLSENNPRFQDAIRIGLFPRDVEYWDTGFDVNWEIDVFGGTRRRVEGAVARIEEEAYQQQALRITVAAEVARNYLEIVGNQQKLEILEAKIANEEKRIQVLQQKHRCGLIPEKQIFKNQSRKQEFQSLKPKLQADIQAGQYRLAVLMGRRPEKIVTDLKVNRPLPISEGQVPIGLPSDLLLRRPDILAAERKLAAATADIGAAKADFFPRFYLTGSPKLESGDFSDLFNSASTAWMFGPKVTWKIFSGARNKAQLETARAVREQTFIEYEIIVNKALEEVESSLTRYGKDAQSLHFVTAAMESKQKELDIQFMKHQTGLSDYIVVADSRREWLDAKWNRLGQQVVVLTRVVALFKSLGGGWSQAREIKTPPVEKN
jgi:NodT family efflux transporter outer membrane factor (OMF) lipoprotein